MRSVIFSPDAAEDIKELRDRLRLQFGHDKAKEHIDQLRSEIRNLRDHPEVGLATAARFGIESEFLCAFLHHNYVFFTYDEQSIKIINIFDERQAILWRMFHVRRPSFDSDGFMIR